MKSKDWTLIIVVVFISVIASIIVSKAIISTPKNRQQKVEVIDPITSDFPAPDTKYFNSKSVDPTHLIRISTNANNGPFSTGR